MTPPPPPLWVFDVECYSNYFLLMARNIGGRAVIIYERFNGVVLVEGCLPPGTLVSFNGNNYDLPMIAYARTGASNAALKALSDAIILRNLKPWDAEREFGFERLEIDHIDLIEVAPGQASLKIYGGRLHSRRMQDLPIEPSAVISEDERWLLIEYCGNDLLTTLDLYRKLEPQLALRVQMGREWGLDLRSKSDAQIAEAVIRKEVEARVGHRVYRPELASGYQFQYRMPDWVSFEAPGLKQVLDIIRDARFGLEIDGSVELPPVLESMRLRIGRAVYRMGIGGLHSSETCVAHVPHGEYFIVDRDVASYYPSIILNQGLYPPHMGPQFLEVYRGIVERRLSAKASGDKVMADALKITINGSFGKLGSKWSVLYSPDLLIAVTLTGQLALLMLIEAVEAAGLTVLSANTDGVVIKGWHEERDTLDGIVAAWEMATGFITEETEYSAVYSKDVNNYVAVKPSGEVKLKGLYATEGLQKNATNSICVEAVLAYLTRGVPVATTVSECADVRKFLTIRQVKGGAVYEGLTLGKAVRWYYAAGETRHISYASNGNKVARSDGARPLMQLPDALPFDLDMNWYVQEAESILRDIGL